MFPPEMNIVKDLLIFQTKDRDGNEFLLNVCGPLVVTDVPRSGCNPQGVCGYYNGDYVGQIDMHYLILIY